VSELEAIRKADLVCCISREEQWLLGLYDVPSMFLPYMPTEETQRFLHEIRSLRASSTKDVILVLGTARNNPTRLGLEALIPFLRENESRLDGCKFVVAGYGTEQLLGMGSESIEVLGTIGDSQLMELFVRARACLIHQVPTTGCLVRVTELLISGVPVVTNFVGARTYHNIPGVHTYERMEHLLSLINNIELAIPPPLTMPRKYEAHVIDELRRLSSLGETEHSSM
jgi:hypothetical protein